MTGRAGDARPRVRDIRLALVGFGNVGRRLAERLTGPYARSLKESGARVRVTGIATARHGLAIDPRGIDLRRALRLPARGRSLEALHRGPRIRDVHDFIHRVVADVLVEITPLDPRRGEPAISHVRRALGRGMHVVTANKGPVAFALRSLKALARRKRRLFLHEGAVMDGTPVFNLAERCLRGARILSFRGTLNSTTNLVLSRMEEGLTASAAVKEAQALGIAEADPRNDLEGWDAAVKGSAVANGLMDASVRPSQVRRRGIMGVSRGDARRALRAGTRLRLVVRGVREGRRVRVSVAPERIPLGDPLSGSGPDAALVLETDLMGEIGVFERGATVDQTAYALLSDLIQVVREG
ncbi:MAG TPA: homoserine dehydrogenase [Vicinamibacteria bacterium]|nr:homoserine dehydrogenase [Vicinamibacteria bacterium]